MTLRELLQGVEVLSVHGTVDLDQTIGRVRGDSRAVAPGDVFVAVPGHRADGHAFVQAAVERGASAVVVERDRPCQVARVQVRSSGVALGQLAANELGRPADRMTLIGVTGTNGKTTTTYLVESILAAAGAAPGLIGTVQYRYGGIARPAELTTPGALALQNLFAEMAGAHTSHVVMEVSSIALDQARLAGTAVAVAAFTNLTQDHLDYHGTIEAYFEAKARLFTEYLRAQTGVAVAYVDFPQGAAMLGRVVRNRTIACSTRAPADVWAKRAELGLSGIEAELGTPRGPLTIGSPLLAEHNLQNIVVAVGIAEALGLPHGAIAAGIAGLRGVPGRLERVAMDGGPTVLVDYAHTPDALERALIAVRPLTRGRVILVFGCGGDRDRGKRPQMGQIAARGADLPIVTSDNPRTEDPASIVEMIVEGVRVARSDGFVVEVDRRAAIRRAIAEAKLGDVVLIAGKGHEDYQILGKEKLHFDDREEALRAARELGSGQKP